MNMTPAKRGLTKTTANVRLGYHLCPRCQRTVSAESGEQYCSNDGAPLLQACHHCGAAITSPYSHFCTACGQAFSFIEKAGSDKPQ